MKSRYASPLLPQAEALSQRTSGADNFIDLTGDDCAGGVTGENNFVDLTGLENLSDPAVLIAYYTESVEFPSKEERENGITPTGDEDAPACVDHAYSILPTTNVLDKATDNNHDNSIKMLDQIIFKLDRMNANMAFTSYTLFIASAKEYNATAYIPTSHLDVPPHIIPPPGLTVHQAIVANVMAGLPAYPDPNLEVPPFPRTLKGIMKLTKANLIAVENYYGLSHDGNVADRRDRIKQSYGVTDILDHYIAHMKSLLQLPQDIWREKILFLFRKVEDLARLDSAVMNKSDRTIFHSNINGCNAFGYINNKKMGIVKWFSLRNLIVRVAAFSAEIQSEETPHLRRLLAQVACIQFSKGSLFQNGACLQKDWLQSKNLSDLSIVGCDIEDLSALSNCSALLRLNIIDCPHVSSASFSLGIKGCLMLHYICLQKCAKLRYDAVIALIQSCAALSIVNICGMFYLEKVFDEITEATKISSFLCVDKSSVLTGSLLSAIATVMPRLSVARLQLMNNTIDNDDVIAFASKCTNLIDIQLYNNSRITNTSLPIITQQLPKLETLLIDFCWSITDAGVITLAQSATNLRMLRLNHLLDVTDTAIQAVGTHCRLLGDLDVQHCVSLTDAAFTTLNVAKLRRLNVSGTRITGTFAAHIFSETSDLRLLVCSACDFLTVAFVNALPARYTKLFDLYLGKSQWSEADWLQLSTKFPSLFTLKIKNNVIVNDTIAQSFRANCPRLKNLLIEGCSVSEEV